MKPRWNCVWLILGLGLLVAASGCGDRNAVVKGRVTYDGKPIEKGAISFDPADGNGPTSGGAILDGQYELNGKAAVPPGPKIVRIRATRKTGRKVPAMPGSSTMEEEVKDFIPANFNNKSTLKREVESGKINEFNFDLKTP